MRNVAIIGGNICNGMTSADGAPPLFALNAVLKLRGAQGVREVPIRDFYAGPGKVAIEPDEILTSITVAREHYEGFHGCFFKYAVRNAMDIAAIGCAAACKLEDNRLKDLRIAYGVAGPTPLRCGGAEAFARGKTVSRALLSGIAEAASKELKPRDSWRATREFRLHIIKTLATRVLEQAIIRAGGDIP